ncbi:MAG: diguanylate cyclase, partial [Heliobacteriaceae bacterium]|nr:diguanylate cyclase [Heliobacteriaceae bacterium]
EASQGNPVCYFAEGVTSHERGCYISHPLLDPQQAVTGVFVVKKDMATLEANFTQHPFCFLLDPHGVIFLAGRSDLRLKTLWPLTDEAKEKLLVSRQFGDRSFTPLLSQAVSTEANVVLEGKPLVVTQQPIAHKDWSLVLLNSSQQLLAFRVFSQSFILILCLLTVTFFAIHELTRKSAAQLAASESQLRVANQKLEYIINFLPDPTFVIDQDKKVIAWNQAIEKLTGIPKEQMIGKGDFAYALPFYGKPRPLLIDLLDREAFNDNLAYKYVTKHGNYVYGETFIPSLCGGKGAYLWGTASPLFDKDGKKLGAIESIRDITHRAELENQLKYLSLHDPLTGLFNRAYFEQELERLQNGGKKYLPVGVIVADANGLKLINDTLGHEAGDNFLQVAASIFRDSFRQNDLVARIGGDEFAVVLPNSNPAILETACKRIRQAIARHNAAHPELPISFSLGTATTNEPAKSLHDLCKEADDRMYREKLLCREISRNTIVNGLMKALEARDYLTEGHTERLLVMATDLAARLGLAASVVANLQLLAKFHDIGKVGIPEHIIFKSGPLTPEEALEMQRHCEIGYRIAQTVPALEPVAELILNHHEWWDGQGYPAGLKGEAIPLECRILAVIHAYDTMIHDRPYRRALPHTTAIAEIQRYHGSKFDPELVPQFIALVEENQATIEQPK